MPRVELHHSGKTLNVWQNFSHLVGSEEEMGVGQQKERDYKLRWEAMLGPPPLNFLLPREPLLNKGSTCPPQIAPLAGNQVFTCEPVETIHIQTLMMDLAFCLKNHSLIVAVKDHMPFMQGMWVFFLTESSYPQSHIARTARSSPHSLGFYSRCGGIF